MDFYIWGGVVSFFIFIVFGEGLWVLVNFSVLFLVLEYSFAGAVWFWYMVYFWSFIFFYLRRVYNRRVGKEYVVEG